MTLHEFQQLEDATLEALAGLSELGLRTLEPYADQLNVEDLEAATYQFPCIYVIAGPLRQEIRNRYDEQRVQVTLIVGDRNVRGSEAATRGDSESPGVYALLREARLLLHRKRVASDWSTFECIGEEVVAFAPKSSVCVYAATYTTKRMTQ